MIATFTNPTGRALYKVPEIGVSAEPPRARPAALGLVVPKKHHIGSGSEVVGGRSGRTHAACASESNGVQAADEERVPRLGTRSLTRNRE